MLNGGGQILLGHWASHIENVTEPKTVLQHLCLKFEVQNDSLFLIGEIVLMVLMNQDTVL